MSALDEHTWSDDGLPVAVVRTNSDLWAKAANDAWRELAGVHSFSPGKEWTTLFDPDERSSLLTWLRRFSRSNRTEPLEIRGRATGQWFELRAAPGVRDPSNGDLIVTVLDITMYKRREAQLVFDATHDSLTGLRNRASLIERIEQALHRLQRHPAILAVLFIDLDGFKRINDRYGHDDGDDVLRAVAQRLSTAVRPSDTLARLGGDEFVVVCESLSSELEAFTIARRLDAAVRSVELAARRGIQLSAAVGVAFAEGSQDRPTAMLGRADRAMYLAKQSGQNPAVAGDVSGSVSSDSVEDLRPRFVDILVRLAGELDGQSALPDSGDAAGWEFAGEHVRKAIAILTEAASPQKT